MAVSVERDESYKSLHVAGKESYFMEDNAENKSIT